jgi:hypothetical protein
MLKPGLDQGVKYRAARRCRIERYPFRRSQL